MDIVLDGEDGTGLYALAKCSNDTFYIVKKNTQSNNDVSDREGFQNAETNNGLKDWSTETERSRPSLPNFWIIVKVHMDQLFQNETNTTTNSLMVIIYFHCR